MVIKTAFWEERWIEGSVLKTSSGDFSVASVRKAIDDKLLPDVDSKTRWIKYVPIKVNVHAWKVKTALERDLYISRRGIDIESMTCAICGNEVETMRGARLIPESQLELVPHIGNIINKRKSLHQLEDDVSEMENRKKKKKRRLICASWPLDDFPELMHRILSSLPAKEAARTCVLSKSWLHAWSTIPNIRFPFKFILPQNKYNQFMERSLLSLRNLKELKIHSVDESPVLEISDVPSLRELRYLPMLFPMTKPPPFDMESLGSVIQLNVGGIILDHAFFDIIRSKLHFLESLTLGIGHVRKA
ncbi:RNA-directed DNA polymerase, eukaryota [Tanacetum coccineum]